MAEDLKVLTVDNLPSVRFYVDGVWVNAKDATDTQFGEWAKTYVDIEGDVHQPWGLEERAAFCDHLWQFGLLHMLKPSGLIGT